MHNIPLKPLYMFTIIGLNKKEKKKTVFKTHTQDPSLIHLTIYSIKN